MSFQNTPRLLVPLHPPDTKLQSNLLLSASFDEVVPKFQQFTFLLL